MNFVHIPSRNAFHNNSKLQNYLNESSTRSNLKIADDIQENFESDDFIGNQEIKVECLRTVSDIKKIAHLRKQIDLSAHYRIDKDFDAKEKKKTKLDW